MKLQNRIAMVIMLVGTGTLIILGAVYAYQTLWSLRENQAAQGQLTAIELARHFNSHLDEQANIAMTLASAPVIRNNLLRSNELFSAMTKAERAAQIDQLNQQWMAAAGPDDPFVRPYLENEIGQYLRRQFDVLPGLYGEIFLTNRYGVLVGSTGKLTTMAHGAKYWWQAAYDDGNGRIFFDDRGFDASVEGYVLGVVVPVMDGSEIIGILKSNVNIDGPLTDLLANADADVSGQILMVRTGGLVVYALGVEPLSTQVAPEVADLLAEKSVGTATIQTDSGAKTIAFAPLSYTLGSADYGFGGNYESLDQIKGNQGEAWHVVYMSDAPQLPDILSLPSFFAVGMLGSLLVLLTAGVSLLFGRWVSRPIVELAGTARALRMGNLGVRANITVAGEVGQLASDFNRMAQDLEASHVESERLYAEIQQRAASLETEVAERTRELKEKSLALAQNNQELEHFAYIASHDLQAPLRAVRGYLDIFRRRYGDGLEEQAAELIERAIAGGERMSQLIEALLAFTRAGTIKGERIPVDLNEVVETSLRDLQAEISEAGALVTVEPLPTVNALPQQMQQIFDNLLSNALKYNLNPSPRVHVGVVEQEDRWRFSIADNGMGIPEDEREKIFGMFRRLHNRQDIPGTGIGLAICQKIVERHQGRIWVESEVEVGSTFFFTLPR